METPTKVTQLFSRHYVVIIFHSKAEQPLNTLYVIYLVALYRCLMPSSNTCCYTRRTPLFLLKCIVRSINRNSYSLSIDFTVNSLSGSATTILYIDIIPHHEHTRVNQPVQSITPPYNKKSHTHSKRLRYPHPNTGDYREFFTYPDHAARLTESSICETEGLMPGGRLIGGR